MLEVLGFKIGPAPPSFRYYYFLLHKNGYSMNEFPHAKISFQKIQTIWIRWSGSYVPYVMVYPAMVILAEQRPKHHPIPYFPEFTYYCRNQPIPIGTDANNVSQHH